MPQVLDDLKTQVSASTSVDDSATLLINGIAQRVADAVAAAIGNGATAEQLAPVTDEIAAMKASSAALAAAVTANTPAAKKKP